MAIRLPLTGVLDYNNTTIQGGGPTSVAGGVAKSFILPQDTDNVVVKLQASILGGGVSATFQTSDDGGTTWYDVQRTSIVSNANGTTAEFLNVSTITPGVKTTYISGTIPSVGGQAAASIFSAIGSAAASTLGQLAVSGLPIMGVNNRIFLRYTAGVSSIISERVEVKVNNQSATA